MSFHSLAILDQACCGSSRIHRRCRIYVHPVQTIFASLCSLEGTQQVTLFLLNIINVGTRVILNPKSIISEQNYIICLYHDLLDGSAHSYIFNREGHGL